MIKNVAIILAGGTGSRFGRGLPKQFLKVAGKSVIEHTIDVFEKNSNIDEICIVSNAEYISMVEQLSIKNQYKKVHKILAGGKERYHSSLAAINAYSDNDINLIFHDAVRPLVNNRIINDCIKALSTYNAVDVAIPTTDTIICVNEGECIDNIPNRNVLRNGQTPQCFKRGLIKHAYDIALQDTYFSTTDDCGVVRKYLPDEPVFVVRGELFNMKLTYIEDLYLLDKLFQLKTIKGIDERLFNQVKQDLSNKVVVVFGGSSGIGKEIMEMAGPHNHFYGFSRALNNVDVSKISDVEEALQKVYDMEGRIDAVVNTAGVLYKEPLYSMSYEIITSSVDINLLGVINVAKASFKYLKQSNGSVLFYTSSSYTRGRMLYSVYSATKAAIVNFVQAIAEEWQEFGIRVNCINPERTNTPMRVKNFGIEPKDSLLDAKDVAIASLNTLFSDVTGEVIDVKRR